MIPDLVTLAVGNVVVAVVVVSGWVMYWRERHRSRDYVTDLMGIVYKHDLGREDLRRALGHDEVEERLEKWNDDG